jgi:hypothetical protein
MELWRSGSGEGMDLLFPLGAASPSIDDLFASML